MSPPVLPGGGRTGDRARQRDGTDPISGFLVATDAQEVVIRREDPRVGKINVHFPRAGFDVTRQ